VCFLSLSGCRVAWCKWEGYVLVPQLGLQGSRLQRGLLLLFSGATTRCASHGHGIEHYVLKDVVMSGILLLDFAFGDKQLCGLLVAACLLVVYRLLTVDSGLKTRAFIARAHGLPLAEPSLRRCACPAWLRVCSTSSCVLFCYTS
jgi:hypothetical protein